MNATFDIADKLQEAGLHGRTATAIPVWRELLNQMYVDETDYSDWCRELAEIYLLNNRTLAAARIYEYLLSIDQAVQHYQQAGEPRDVGRVYALGRQHTDATENYQEARLYALAARSAENGGSSTRAIQLYEQLARAHGVAGQDYLASLALLNVGRLQIESGHEKRARPALASATALLDKAADERERKGNREGAFRCYLSLIKIGMLEKSYENIAQGFLNCIRILKAKSDRFFTMQYYYGLIRLSESLEEHHSVAELFREAGEYARRIGFIYADYFLLEAGNAWQNIAKLGIENHNPTELVENALLAAAGCFNRIQDDHRVAECYQLLSELPLPEKKIDRFSRLADEIREDAWEQGKHDVPMAFPAYFRREITIPEIWRQDLILAESGNSIPDAIGRLVGDHKNVWEVQRRKALLIALQYDDHIQANGDPYAPPHALIFRICELGHAAAVSPLSAIFQLADPSTQSVILSKAPNLKKKEVFELIEMGLASTDEHVIENAVKALHGMSFPQALDPLVQIFNASSIKEARSACLSSIARIGTDEACEFLLDIMRSNRDNFSKTVQSLLKANAQERMLSALTRNKRSEPDRQLAKFLDQLIVQIRGERRVRGM